MDHPKAHGRRPAGWQLVLCQLDWTCIFCIIILGIGTAVVGKRLPVSRPIYLWDATISYPHYEVNSVAFWVAVVLPVLVLVATAAVLEYWALRQQGWRQATVMLINVLLALLATLAVTGFLTELFKRMCGRLRPDFLDRCDPAKPAAGINSQVSWGSWPNVTCTAEYDAELKDGHMSFPSGHSSCSMAVGLFSVLYMMWAIHWRCRRDLLSPTAPAAAGISGSSGFSFGYWLRQEVLRLVVLLVILFQLAWPWGVAVSRFRDNRHNASDVVGGLLLGACFAPFFAARLASNWHCWEGVRQQEEGQQPATLEMVNSGGSVLPMVSGHSLSYVQGPLDTRMGVAKAAAFKPMPVANSFCRLYRDKN